MNAIEISNLCVELDKFKIDGLNLTVRKGAITGLVGANGSGKTTLIKTIMRVQDAVSGSILYNGKKFAGNEKEIFSSLACVFDDVIFSTYAKPKKIVKLYKDLYPSFDEKRYYELVEKFALPQDLRVYKYSFGMKKKLGFILELCRGAETLIFDEPTSGIDPFDRSELMSLLQEYMLDENHAVLFSTHITEDLDKIADYIVMMDGGRILLDSDKESLMERFRLVRAAELTEGMQRSALGLKQDMFGYTFLTESAVEEGEGVQVKTPSIEEIFVHLTSQKKSNGSSENIFGI